MEWDYQLITQNLQDEKIISLMQQLGCGQCKETDNYIIFPTICHNDDVEHASEKLYYYKDSHLFYCYTNCDSMSIFTFLKHYYETREIEYNWYTDIYSVAKNCSIDRDLNKFEAASYKTLAGRYDKRKKINLPVLQDSVLDCFVKMYPPEWLADGITEAAMDKYNILYSITQNKIIIPHYDVHGRLVGIRGRALNPDEVEQFGKYAPIKIEQKWYSHQLSGNLYGLNFNKENIKKAGIVYVFESEKSVLQCEAFSEPNCAVAVCGSNFNKFQLDLLLKYCYPDEVVICFDKEEKKGEDKYFNKLMGICNRYKQYCNFSFIYDRENLLNLKDSPSDRGEIIFRQLLKRRVKIK